MKKILLISLTIIVGLGSCKKERVEGKIRNNSKLADELKSSPENLLIGNNNLILTANLWRDFMPVAEENGSKMICLDQLTEVDRIPILSTIELKKQYVIKGSEVWIADYSEIRKGIDYILEGYVNGGPKWGPNIEVDVVCEFENSGTTYRILAKSVLIHKTE